MKHTFWVVVLLLLSFLGLSACGGAGGDVAAIPTVSLDTPGSAGHAPLAGNTTSSGGTVIASAQVLPVNTVSLSFPLTGSVLDVAVKDGDTVAAGDMLVQLDTAILQARVAEAEANVAAAETQVAYLRRITNSSAENIQAAEADVARLQAVLTIALETLQQATLVSPIDGTVAAVEIARGETVTPGLVVVIVGDLSRFELETTDLSERDVVQVQAGQPVEVYIEALDQRLSGQVHAVANQASTLGGDVIYTVTVSLDENIPGLRWGMSAEVTINVGE